MAKQGLNLSQEKIQRIVTLLKTTPLTRAQIGARTGTPAQTVSNINNKFEVRPKGRLKEYSD